MTSLISILGELNLVEDLINCVDEDGNTVLHLTTYTNQYQRGGSSDQRAADVLIITASNGCRNEEEQQQQIVDVDSSHGAGDHSSDKAKDDDKEQDSTVDSIKNGIIVVCSLFAIFYLEAILNLPGGIDREQLQSKPMNIADGHLINSDHSSALMSRVSFYR
ncbi:hypothetical protein QYF36_009416 [Acer negundo]|nr:hypothetical protein QYF36_009416 [Acer negundo]